jgi:hypothetical protein
MNYLLVKPEKKATAFRHFAYEGGNLCLVNFKVAFRGLVACLGDVWIDTSPLSHKEMGTKNVQLDR